MRFKLNELNVRRILNAILRRIKSWPHKLSWILLSNSNKTNLKKFKNKYVGQTCFLVANGPSLKKMDLSFLKNKISFGLNRIYLGYNDMGFKNDYLVCINKLVLEQFSSDISNLDIPKFLNWECRKTFREDKNAMFICKNFFGKRFGKQIHRSLNPAATVTYAALQVIYYMGFKDVIIIGLDHNFITKNKKTPNRTELRTEEIDVNHFHPNYFPKGSKWETPDLISSEYFYKLARDIFEKDNRKIYDCTVDGKCEVFEKSNLERFLKFLK